MRRVQEVTLEIIYEDRHVDAPSRWDWSALLDVPEGADVVVVEAGEPRALRDVRAPLRKRGRSQPHEESGWDGEAA